ncbi:beta-ketoacyl synthase N-terminal-like domain-containing protein [Actinokineospora sp. UTMC 2448]|uniref:beta-ketoacyl synthase N-terminal-like domain-containing protein n=1 Tax=Actinokineospora sp. UTMC 2448 TaxID=2268449 RepID=UPI002164B543|nr:beta-ketoacyl synthase N-terminal-like domain-containing protein [Actinokineospora sp. UTMC 2448]UVS80646.1 3-oxoacyl-[acyl-carrier-protein] synthase 2 [Actinokineospora sp. UTMC 2448]
MRRVVVTGVGVTLPRASSPQSLLTAVAHTAEPVNPETRIGKKGLRYKDRATQLGYCAADATLRDAGLLREKELTVADRTVGVVASSNLGNVDTVVEALDTIAAESTMGTSPMGLPNASSNVIATSIAIRFGLRGPNLMVCNGATSGLDAIHWATTMIAAGRAPRMLVVGVEPDNEPVRKLLGGRRAIDGAVGVLLEDADAAAERGAVVRATIGRYARTGAIDRTLAKLADGDTPALWHAPEGESTALPGVPRYDLAKTWGVTSGAHGVLQCAAAIGWFEGGGTGPVYALAGAAEATAGLVLRP